MPVREALQRLVAERGLVILPNRSVQVPVLTKESFDDLTRVRLELEGFAAELAASRISEAEMDELVRSAGFKKLDMKIGPYGIFTVSTAQK